MAGASLRADTRRRSRRSDLPAPSFDEFWARRRPDPAASSPTMAGSCAVSATIRTANRCRRRAARSRSSRRPSPSFGEPDCPGHPAWLAPAAGAERRRRRCFSSPTSRRRGCTASSISAATAPAPKHRGREVARMHPDDAAARGIADGDIIRLFNARGACLAGVRVTDGIRPGVVQLPTGAWYDPADPEEEAPLCVHGNPNVLDARRRHLGPGAGLHRAADDGRGRALQRQSAADPGLRSAGCFQGGCGCQARKLSHGQDRPLFHAGNGACGRDPRQKIVRRRNHVDGAGPHRRVRAEAECVCASGGGGGDGRRGNSRQRVCQGKPPSDRCTAFP